MNGKKFQLTFMKGHFHLAQFSDPLKIEPCGNVLCNPINKLHIMLIWVRGEYSRSFC